MKKRELRVFLGDSGIENLNRLGQQLRYIAWDYSNSYSGTSRDFTRELQEAKLELKDIIKELTGIQRTIRAKEESIKLDSIKGKAQGNV